MKKIFLSPINLMVGLCFSLMTVFPTNLKASSINAGGTISVNTVWSADTVKVIADVLISNGITLTVNPGVVVIFQGHYKIDVQGRIRALGNINDEILFTINDTTGFSNSASPNGGWLGIRFDSTLSTNDTSYLKFCRIEYGKANGSGDLAMGGGVFIFNFNKVVIKSSEFFSNIATSDGGAIYVKNATAFIGENRFLNGKCARGAGIHCENSWPRIQNNTFSGNYATGMGGCICTASGSAPSIINNLMYDNLAFLGGGIAFINAGNLAIAVSNTIAMNRANYGGGMSSIASNPSLINTILFGNIAADGHQVALLDPNSDPNFNYCDIQGGLAAFSGSGSGASYSGIYTNNMDSYPKFADTLIADFQIKTASPCLDAGTPDTTGLHLPTKDIAGNPRINMGRIDIGAFERQQVVSYCGVINQNTIWNADTVKLTCDIIVENGITLNIVPGVIVQAQGAYKITVKGRLLALGTSDENIIFTSKNFVIGWKGIHLDTINAANDTTILRFCQIQWVKNLPAEDGSVVIRNSSKVLIDNGYFTDNEARNGGGISIFGSSPVIINTTIDGNLSDLSTGKGGAIYIGPGSNPWFDHLLIANNYSFAGGGIYCEESDVSLYNAIIANNTSFTYGGGIYSDTCNLLLKNCIIVNNGASNFGGGIYSNRSLQVIINSNIVNNQGMLGAGIAVMNSDLDAYNSIIYGNTDLMSDLQVHVFDTLSETSFYYCDIKDDTTGFTFESGVDFQGDFIGNIDTLPGFINPSVPPGTSGNGLTADWSLDGCSPLFNMGNHDTVGLSLPALDYNGYQRIYADTVDIGPFELVKPYFVGQPHDSAACAGDDVSFSVNVESSITVTYQWQIKPYGGGSFINASGPDANSPEYNIYGIIGGMNGDQYQCIISGDCSSSIISSHVTLTVHTAPAIGTEPTAVEVCQNSAANFSVTASGSNLSYQWQQRTYGGATWSNCIGASATTANYSIPSTPLSLDGYSYRCIITGVCQPGDTTIIVDLTVKGLPSVVTQPTNVSVCEGGNATFTVSGNGSGISYQWQESTNGGTIWNNMGGQTTNSTTLTAVTLGMNGYKYRCIITGDCSPAATSNVATLTVNTPPIIGTQPSDADACVNSNVNIPVIATGGNLSFQWQQKSPTDLVWSNAPGLSALTSTYQLTGVSILLNGYKYKCLIGGSCPPSIETDSVVLHVHNLPSFYVGPDTTMLLSETITLDAGGGFAGYHWSTGDNTQIITVIGTVAGIGIHQYTCTVTDNNGCENYDALLVTVLDDTGLDDLSSNSGFSIVPNPANTYFVIKVAGNTNDDFSIEITSMTGQLVYSKTSTIDKSEGLRINISDWPVGVYYIKANSNENCSYLKLIKL
jgi:predicted outer membrane repeat protein